MVSDGHIKLQYSDMLLSPLTALSKDAKQGKNTQTKMTKVISRSPVKRSQDPVRVQNVYRHAIHNSNSSNGLIKKGNVRGGTSSTSDSLWQRLLRVVIAETQRNWHPVGSRVDSGNTIQMYCHNVCSKESSKRNCCSLSWTFTKCFLRIGRDLYWKAQTCIQSTISSPKAINNNWDSWQQCL